MKQASLFWYKKNTFHRNFLKKNTPYLLRDTSGLLFDTQSKVFFCLSVCLLFRTNEICVISFINGSFVYFLCYEHHRLFLLKATVSKFERQQKFVHPPSFLFLRLVFSIQSSLNCLSVCLFVCPQKWKYREFFNKLQICVLVQEFAAPQTPAPSLQQEQLFDIEQGSGEGRFPKKWRYMWGLFVGGVWRAALPTLR